MNQQQKGKGSLGLSAKVEKMDPKKKKLFNQMISIVMLFSMTYAVFSFAFMYQRTGSFMAWFSGSDFVTVVVLLVFAGLGYKILQGGEFHMPDEFKKKEGQKTQFNMPKTWGVQSFKPTSQQPQPQTQQQQPQLYRRITPKPQSFGAWQCPQCNEFTVGPVCRNCGYVRQ